MNSSMSGWLDVEDDHLGGAAGLAAGLDRAGDGVGAAHEGDGAGGEAAGGDVLAASCGGSRG